MGWLIMDMKLEPIRRETKHQAGGVQGENQNLKPSFFRLMVNETIISNVYL